MTTAIWWVSMRNGKHLWHFQMGEGLTASYVAIASSTAIFSFGLFEPVQSLTLPRTLVESR
jgi:hypothetical protein